jgi:hypothetical protein
VPKLLVLLVAAAATFACASSAGAHEGGTHTGFAARVSTIDPFLPGLLITVIGGHERLSAANLTDKRIVILDEDGETLVRIAPGKTEVWTEPRIGADTEPPQEEGLVRNWRIAGRADGEPFEILGFLGYRPPPAAESNEGSGLPAFAIVLAAGGLLVLGAAALRFRRTRS